MARNITEEIWESTIPGRISVAVEDSRTGRPRTISILGKGKRLRISTHDREVAEEVADIQTNPFRNGMLVPITAAPESKDELSDDDLTAMFEVTGPEFEEMVSDLSEVNIRRLWALTEPVDAARSQADFLQKLIADRYSVGGPTAEWEAMQQAPKGALS